MLTIEPIQTATHLMIWLHGLGATCEDLMPIAQLTNPIPTIRHLLPQAPTQAVTCNGGMAMPAWYDIRNDLIRDEDREGIERSSESLLAIIDAQAIPSQNIFLAGFSQGGALALHTALRGEHPFAGVIALSSYLPLADKVPINTSHAQMPIFIAAGEFDPLVQPAWSKLTQTFLENQGFQDITWQTYPMEHQICQEEVQDLTSWLATQLVVS